MSTRMSRRLRYTGALLAVSVVVTAVPAAASAEQRTDLQVAEKRTNDLITLVDGDPAAFSGVMFNEDTRVVTVQYPARGSKVAVAGRLRALAAPAPARAAAASVAGSWRVSFVPVKYSRAELEAVRQRVESDKAWQQLVGPTLSQWYVDTERNTVVVGLTEVTPALREEAARRFGGMVELRTERRPQPVSRFDDSEPYRAGTRLEFPPGGARCTAGFTIRLVRNPDVTRMVTAGHCARTGAVVENNRQPFGTVDFSQYGGLDVAYISGRRYFPGTYVGPIFSEDVRDVRGGVLNARGLRLCANGAFTGERCAGEVIQTNVCVVYLDGVRVCRLTEMRPMDGRSLAQPGDSGGPVHTYDHFGNLLMAGFISGTNGYSTWFHPFGVVMPSGWELDYV